MKSRTKSGKTIRLLAVALTLAMAVSMLAVPASAASSNTARKQTTETTQQESGKGLNAKAAVGALGMGAVVYFYLINPTAWQKVSSAAQLVLSDVASDARLLLGDVADEAMLTFSGAVANAKEEWNRRKERAAAEEGKDEYPAAQDAETEETGTQKTGTQGSAAQSTPKSDAKADEEDAAESAQVVVKLGGTSAA